MEWEKLSVLLFGAVDDGRLIGWIQSSKVKPYLDELQCHIPYGENEGTKNPDREMIIKLCVDSKESRNGRYIRDRPEGITTFTTAERYARAVGLIVRENSYRGGILDKSTLAYSDKCDMVLAMIALIGRKSSGSTEGLFKPERGSIDATDKPRPMLPTEEVLEQKRKKIILNNLRVRLQPFGFDLPGAHGRPLHWESLPADELQYQAMIKLHEGYLLIAEKKTVAILDYAGASEIAYDLATRTQARILDSLQDDALVEEFRGLKAEMMVYGVLRPSKQRELEVMARAHKYFGIHANKGPSYITCLRKLGITNNKHPWLRGTAVSLTFFPFQIQGIVWLMQMCLSPLRGGILGDDMGLGKTFQACGLIQAFSNARQTEANFKSKYGEAKVSLIVVPPIVVSSWQYVLETYFPALRVMTYIAGSAHLTSTMLPRGEISATYVVLSTYQIMQRHSLHARQKWEKEHAGVPWPEELRGCVGILVLDEAQNITKAQHSARYSALKLLDADFTVCMTGTLFDNKADDIRGPLGLMSRDELWAHFRTSLRENPFEFEEDDPRSILQCTTNAIDSWIKNCEDDVTKGLWLRMILKRIMRKTTYDTVFHGRKIGELIPPMKEIVVGFLHNKETLTLYLTAAKYYGAKLITSEERKTVNGSMFVVQFHMGIHRILTVMNLWFPLHHIATNWNSMKVDEFRKSNGTLKHLLLEVEAAGYKWPATQPLMECTNPQLVAAVAATSPIIKFTLNVVRNIVVILRRKLVIWADYPLSQLFLELVLSALEINSKAFHSRLSGTARDKLIRDFNTDSSPLQVVVMSTLIGNVGINMQHSCSEQIMNGATASDLQERQCLARLHRLGQKREVIAWKPILKDLDLENQWLRRFLKVVANLMAHPVVDKSEGTSRFSSLSLEQDIVREIEILWQDLQDMIGMPKDASWLSLPKHFSIETDE